MALCSLVLGLVGEHLAEAALWPLIVLFGLTASGWNGVFLAEVARRSPPEATGRATAVALVLMSVGLVLGPLAFSAIAASAGWDVAFAVWSVVAVGGIIGLVTGTRS